MIGYLSNARENALTNKLKNVIGTPNYFFNSSLIKPLIKKILYI